ncbi:hypothetical protein RMATCC62417_18682 [Rhizopus microsporus]|nr:hypothetical protein RMATCC62417_18682 [Rhizopus microsporus]
MNYFLGKGIKEWCPSSFLIINNVNITTKLLKIRLKSIKYAEAENNINTMRVLSLSHVFPINRYDKGFCVTTYMKNDSKELLQLAYSNVVMQKASSKALTYVHSLLHGVFYMNHYNKPCSFYFFVCLSYIR